MYASNALGFSLNPARAVKRAAKGVAKGVSKGAVAAGRGAVAAGRTAANVALLPHKILLRVVLKAAIPLARTMCSAPEEILQAGAVAANVSVSVVPLFCAAVRANNMSQVRALLPQVLKIAVKVAATGAFPALGPTLAMIRAIPGLRLVPGLSFLAGGLGSSDISYSANGYNAPLSTDAGEDLAAAVENVLMDASDADLQAAMGFTREEMFIIGGIAVGGLGAILAGILIARR